MSSILLIDLSHVFWSTWFASAGKPIDYTFQTTIQAVARLAEGYDHVGVCCDSGRSFRSDLYAEYKANRPERDAVAYEQARRVEERLDADGFQLFSAKGFEADDVIATLTAWATDAGHAVTIATNDKDLMQLVSGDVRVLSTRSGEVYGVDEVHAKLGVHPAMVHDWLALVGDASDNVPGVKGVGAKTGAALLVRYKSIDAILAAAEGADEAIKPALRDAILTANAAGTLSLASQLVALRYDAPIDCERLLVRKEPTSIVDADFEEDGVAEEEESANDKAERLDPTRPIPRTLDEAFPKPYPDWKPGSDPLPPSHVIREMARRAAKAPPSAPAPLVLRSDPNWSMALEPNTINEAKSLAANIANGRMFAAYGSAEAIFSVILMGRSMGIDAMTALRGFHVVEGRPTMSAQLMAAVVMRSGKAKYFRCIESTREQATYETLRDDDTEPRRCTFTIDDAKLAKLVKPNGNWEKSPRAMLRARATSELARMVYPDVILNVYTPEEFEAGDNPNAYGVDQ